MIRNCSIEEISDGKLYSRDDLVKANCLGCVGCSDCCHGMGNTVVLDPYDVFRLTTLRNCSFQDLLAEGVELGIVDGLILPSLKMNGTENACFYLNEEGRCKIHEFRPGICRLFPLGRYYDNDRFYYFLQVNECSNKNRSKIKVKQWIDTSELKKNEEFEIKWHYFLKNMQKYILDKENEAINQLEDTGEKNIRQQICMKILETFYVKEYTGKENFYDEFYMRFNQFKELLIVE